MEAQTTQTTQAGRGRRSSRRSRAVVGVLVLLLAGYFWLAGDRALILFHTGDPLLLVLGGAVLVLPVIGGLLVWLEIRFGHRSERLADQLAAEGGLVVDDLPRRPSGRVERAAADAAFVRRRREVEEAPEDWRRWFRLGLAYDDAGDRRRARAAVRRAIALHRADPS